MLVGIVLAVVPNWKFDASSTELAFSVTLSVVLFESNLVRTIVHQEHQTNHDMSAGIVYYHDLNKTIAILYHCILIQRLYDFRRIGHKI